jgi:CheY-like chemotaxis protein
MSLKVLTVDDSKTIRMIVKKAFRPYDCQLLDAENGSEGLAVANREKPDLIVLDITMPVMNGIEMLGKLKEEPALKDIPVIMLTAESGKDNVMQILKMGVSDYMVKPFKGAQLIERAEKIITLEPKKKVDPGGDPSKKFFSLDGDIQKMVIPEKVSRPVVAEIDSFLGPKIKEMVTNGLSKFILDLRKAKEINMALIKLLLLTVRSLEKASINYRIVGTEPLGEELKGFQETSNLSLELSMDSAKASL